MVVGVVVIGLIGAACTTSEETGSETERRRTGQPPVVTMPHRQTTTTLPGGSSGSDQGTTGPTEAAAPAWWIQYGGPGDDQAHGVAAFGNAIYVAGDTTELDVEAPGGLDAAIAIIESNGELVDLTQSLDPSADSARTVALRSDPANAESDTTSPSTSIPPSGPPTTGTNPPQVPSTTVPPSRTNLTYPAFAMACGDQLVEDSAGPLGATIAQGWCSTVTHEGRLETATNLSATSLGSIRSMIFSPEGDDGYVIGDLFHSSFGSDGAQAPPSAPPLRDSLVMRTDGNGTPVWLRQLGQEGDDRSLGVCLTDLGDAVVVGSTTGWLAAEPAGHRDAWISRFDPNGNQRWAVQLGTSEDEAYTAIGLAGEARMGTEAFLATGFVSVPAAPANASSLDENPSGLEGGSSEIDEEPATPHYDAIIHAFGPDGGLLWQVEFGEDGDEHAYAIHVDGNTAYVVGTTTSEEMGELLTDIGPGGGTDGFLAAVDVATGEPRWISRFGTEGTETVTGITATDDGMLVITGHTTGTLNENVSAGGTDAFAIGFPLPAAGGGAARAV